MARRLALVLAAAAALLSPAVARAATGSTRCGHELRCRTVTVPLDRSGTVPGTVPIRVAVQRGSGPVLLVLGGGPGQGMVAEAARIVDLLHEPTGMRIAVVDQRGTGASAIDCPALQRAALTD